MFWDLNVPYPATKQHARQIACLAIQLGYDGIVWSKTVTSKLTAKDACTMELPNVDDVWREHGSQQGLLRVRRPDYDLGGGSTTAAAGEGASAAASSSAAPAASASAFASSSSSFQQKTRVHVLIEDASQLHSLSVSNAALQSYDVVSVSSANEKLFHACCSHESVDIVTIEGAHKMPFYLKKPAINLAIERGIHFEFTYGSAIRDASSRRYLFSNVLSLLRLTRGRNLVLSSALGASRGGGGAGNEQLLDLRAPWDVINLAVMLGIEASVAKATVSAHARAVLLHAEARKTIKCVLREVKLDAEPQQQQQQPQPSSSPSAATAGAASSSSAAAGSGSTTGRSKPARDDNEGPKQKKGKFQK